jgi:hypothetical protein
VVAREAPDAKLSTEIEYVLTRPLASGRFRHVLQLIMNYARFPSTMWDGSETGCCLRADALALRRRTRS